MSEEIKENNAESNNKQPITFKGEHDSVVFGVSVRAWLAILLTLAVVYMSIMKITIVEPLYTLSVTALSFYFGGVVGRASNK